MSGSLDIFQYTSDNGLVYNFRMDVSNGEAVGNTRGKSTAAESAGRYLQVSAKRPVTMRYILCQSQEDDNEKRKIVVGSTSASVWGSSTSTVTLDGDTYDITAKVGEVRYLLPSEDTGITETE